MSKLPTYCSSLSKQPKYLQLIVKTAYTNYAAHCQNSLLITAHSQNNLITARSQNSQITAHFQNSLITAHIVKTA